MGLSEFFSSFIPTVYAEEEEVVEEVVEETPDAEEEVVEEEEEEEEEPEDPKEAIMEECAKQCPSLKHHLDECNERVENGSSENCIEEFFHFMHCADECAAPKLFATTK
ncbi:ubiquinol-cytochrome C reductase hinge protein-domain-containing protein [Chlamydoabsidia padenii]|nr:ubiquinol-cytochrome C reductase hinge protein-domain-containing protein [Chlamydoabsidia padenii]